MAAEIKNHMDKELPRLYKNQKMPGRAYYSLAEAATIIGGCSPEYLLHLASIRKLELVTSRPFELGCLTENISYNGEKRLRGYPFHEPLFLVLPTLKCQELDLYGICDCVHFPSGYHMERGVPALQYPTDFDTGAANADAPTELQIQLKNWRYLLMKDKYLNEDSDPLTLTITPQDLFVIAWELERFILGADISAERLAVIEAETNKQDKIREPLARKTENKLYTAVAALAQLYTNTNCSKPHEAAETVVQELERRGMGKVITRQTLGEYIKYGLEFLHK